MKKTRKLKQKRKLKERILSGIKISVWLIFFGALIVFTPEEDPDPLPEPTPAQAAALKRAILENMSPEEWAEKVEKAKKRVEKAEKKVEKAEEKLSEAEMQLNRELEYLHEYYE